MVANVSFGLGIRLVGEIERKALVANFDMRAGNEIRLQFNPESTALGRRVRSCFVDNAENIDGSILQFGGNVRQRVFVAGQCQQFIPLLISAGEDVDLTLTTTGGVVVKVWFLDEDREAVAYSSIAAGTISGTVAVTGTVTAISTVGAMVNRSGSIAAGGVAQQLAAANGIRRGLTIYNPATSAGQGIGVAPEILYVCFTGAAGIDNGTSYEILPGGYFNFQGIPVANQACSVIAATTGHRWIANEQ